MMQTVKHGRPYNDAVPRVQGAAVLVVTIVVLLLATLGVLTIAQAGITEQRLSAADVRSKEVHAAAVAALDFGVAWLKHHWHELHWQDTGEGAGPGAGLSSDSSGLRPALDDAQMTADSYQHAVEYGLLTPFHTRVGAQPIAIRVVGTARGTADTHVTKSATQDVIVAYTSVFGQTSDPERRGVFFGPPLIVEDCITEAVTGELHLVQESGSGALGTAQGADNIMDVHECLDIAHLPAASSLCDGHGNCQLLAQAIAAATEFRAALAQAQSLWELVFGRATKADLYALEKRHPSRVLVVDDSYPRYAEQPSWHDGLWRASLPANFTVQDSGARHPVILFFDASVGCPTLADDVQVHGLVYIEEADCAGQDWGGGHIQGVLAKAGDLTGLARNTRLVAEVLDYGHADNGLTHGSPVVGLTRIFDVPGSWHDY